MEKDFIKQIQEFNENKYIAVVKNNFKILNNQLSLSYEEFIAINFFEIKEYNYQEQLTNFTNSTFYNSLMIGKQLIDKSYYDEYKLNLEIFNHKFTKIINNCFLELADSENKVEIDNKKEFEKLLLKLQTELYLKVFSFYIKMLGSTLVFNLLKTYEQQHIVNNKILAIKKLDLIIMQEFDKLHEFSLSILSKTLTKIYDQFKLLHYYDQKHEDHHKSQPFSDFQNDGMLFTFDIDDIKSALEILQLNESSSWSEIKTAYRKLAIKYHPDNNNGQESYEMIKINLAYNFLKEQGEK